MLDGSDTVQDRESNCWDEPEDVATEANPSGTSELPNRRSQGSCWRCCFRQICRSKRRAKKTYVECDETHGNTDNATASTVRNRSKCSNSNGTAASDISKAKNVEDFLEPEESTLSKSLSRTKKMGASERGVAIALRPTPRKKLLSSITTSTVLQPLQPTSNQLLPFTEKSSLSPYAGTLFEARSHDSTRISVLKPQKNKLLSSMDGNLSLEDIEGVTDIEDIEDI